MTKLKFLIILAVTMMVLAACGGGTPAAPEATQAPAAPQATQAPAAPEATQAPAAEPTKAPEATAAPAAEPTAAATAEPGPLSAGPLKDVPRNRTVNLGWSISSPIGVTNPWAVPGYTHQEGNAFLWEPLYYFGIFADKDIPWLADSMEYTKPDFTELTIKLNKDAAWSDGTPVTADDVIFTFEGQAKNEKLAYHAQFDQYLKEVKKVDDKTVVVTFKIPAPRFKFEVLTLKFDTGIPIVPAHVLSKQADVNAFAGGLEMPHSGPYNLVQWDKNQKIFDLREDWWAVKAGREALPEVKRIVMVNIGGQVGQNMDIVVQREVNNEFDAILDVRSSVAKQLLDSNPKITSHTGNEPPFGYLDWWPNSLWMNTQIEPYNDPNVRKALSLAIDRDKIDEVVYDGAKVSTIYPFPLYPGLQKFVDQPAVKALEAKYNPREFNLDKSAQLMTAAGFTKNADGLWEKGGKTVNAVINGFEGIHSDIVPVLVEMLKTAGFDANVNFGTDAYQNMADGKPGLYMFGHGASLKDPYAAFELFHSRYSASVGTSAGNNRFSRYKNPDYDKLLDEMAPLGSDDPKFQADAVKLLEIYWKDTIDIPIIQWLHRIPYNQTYWTNWPTKANVAGGTNGAFWAHTGMLVITQLKPAQ
ncbi:MAG TPA: ABC transporter substrate-binding protein [Kouleothrix sp.]|uniref:ABC transporter substrate-binding protein n=1 Tax=Kouleothrix sp. TaxID=2779161 RepID=UPI002CD1C680|nr:ABC transporter substrate-binding protein [Kouleothrix sp.]